MEILLIICCCGFLCGFSLIPLCLFLSKRNYDEDHLIITGITGLIIMVISIIGIGNIYNHIIKIENKNESTNR